jgi:DNA-binding MarR family transcriptional regulator
MDGSMDDFGILLGLAYQGFVEQLHEDLARHGFTQVGSSVGYVLRAVADEPMNQRQLAARLGITDQGTGKIVDEMVEDGFLVRVADPDDARARRLVLGERGKALLRTARAFHARFEKRLAAKLGKAVVATRAVLEEIVAESPAETARRRLRPM